LGSEGCAREQRKFQSAAVYKEDGLPAVSNRDASVLRLHSSLQQFL
jgi:hypothetical protein